MITLLGVWHYGYAAKSIFIKEVLCYEEKRKNLFD